LPMCNVPVGWMPEKTRVAIDHHHLSRWMDARTLRGSVLRRPSAAEV